MRLKNSADLPDVFLRRMVSWCCRELGLPTKHVRACEFTNCHPSRVFRGKAWYTSGRILVRISAEDSPFPFTGRRNSRAPEFTLADRIEALVKVTAHELAHIERHQRNAPRGNHEADTDRQALQVLRAFRDRREELLAAWSAVPVSVAADAPPTANLIEKRHAKAAADLARWERKLKLAKTKVKKLAARVRYYERKGSGS